MPRHVLIVDDDMGIATALRVRLTSAGFEARWVDNGAEGLEAALDQTPDAIVLDLRMPGMNGFEVCQRARASPALRRTPIVVLSANVASEARARSLAAGADCFLGKPYNAAALVQKIRDLIALRAAALPQETPYE